MSPPVLLAFLVLADYRVARLVTQDHITERPRTWLARHSDRRTWRWFGDLAVCPFCVGVHAAVALSLVAWLAGQSLPLPWLWPVAVAGGQAFLAAAQE